jgi:hypothetical protein
MAIERCNHCVGADGQGIELSPGNVWVCPSCACIWSPNSYHISDGRINGTACAYPQPQEWTNDPMVEYQRKVKNLGSDFP